MKLNDLYTVENHEDGAELQIKDENGKKTPLWLTVKGTDSLTYRNELKKQKTAYVEASRNDKTLDTDNFVIDTLVASTSGWRGTDEEFSKELCRELYENAPFVKEQVDDFMTERKNFTKAKPKK